LGTTGNHLVRFRGAVAGPPDAVAGSPLTFNNALGWHIVLQEARLHVGALYLDQNVSTSGGGAAPCILTGTYVAQVTAGSPALAGIDADVLSPAAQFFPEQGEGIDLEAKVGQVWLTGAPVDQVTDRTVILHAVGTADRSGSPVLSFRADLTIGQNRLVAPTDSTKPGASPICLQRIITPIPVDIVPGSGGTLLLRVSPRELFLNIDFAQASPSAIASGQYVFPDDSSDVPAATLYAALEGAGPVYAFTWEPAAP
jgi:hypothetical protein